MTLERHQIKSGLFDLKLTAQDRHLKTILVNDNVRVLEGPSKVWIWYLFLREKIVKLWYIWYLHPTLDVFKLFHAICRINKALLSTYIEGLSFYTMKLRKKIVVTSPLNLVCVKKSNMVLLIALERFEISSRILLGYELWWFPVNFDVCHIDLCSGWWTRPFNLWRPTNVPKISPLTKKTMASKRK